jgi:phosphoribosylformylglycinamidine synthase
MGKYSGGCECELEGAPLKYEGLQPWEVLVSEAQERMTLAVQPEQREAFEALAKRRDVDVAFMGTFNDSGYFTVKQAGVVVASLDMNFLYEDGCPTLDMPAVWNAPLVEPPVVPEIRDYSDSILALLGDLNLCSREYKSRMYDGEVKGLSVVKPFVGVGADVPSDATVLRVDYESDRGAVLAEGINPWYSDIDTYAMTTSVIDEAVRRVIAVGGDLERIAILDNFCWPDPVESEKTPDGAYKMAQLVRSCKALYDLTTLYKTPAVSGKDSCKNDSTRGGKKISIPPTLLISSVGQISDVGQAVTMPFKAVGDLIYVVGETYDELGASAYYRWLAEAQGKPEAFGGAVPQVQGEQALALYRAMNQATAQGLLQSATSPSKGGLALALALATMGSEQGAQIDLSGVASNAIVALFSESNSRFVISVKPDDQQGVEALFAGGSLQLIGEVVEGDALTLKGLATLEREAMRQRFKATLAGV